MGRSSEVLDRFREFLGAKTDTPVAQSLGVSRSTISGWRNRDSIPLRYFVEFAKREPVNLHWLLLGEGPKRFETEAKTLDNSSPAQLSDALRSKGEAVLDELFLGELAAIAELGSLAETWKIIEAIRLTGPQGATLAELSEATGLKTQRLSGHLAHLSRVELVEEIDGKSHLQQSSGLALLRSEGSFEAQQHTLEAVRLLLSTILPAVEGKTGKLITVQGQVSASAAALAVESLRASVREIAEGVFEAEGDEEQLSIVLGLARLQPEVIDS